MRLLDVPRVVHEGPVFSVERRLYAPDASASAPSREGSSSTLVRDIVRHPGAVAVVPVLDDGRIVLIRNHRVAVDAWLVELGAGKLESGEDPAVAAARELEEETGFSATTITALGSFYTSPGFADELMHVFEARGLAAVPQRLESGERITVEMHEVEAILAMLDRGEIRDGKTIAGLLLWLRRNPR